MSEYWHVVDSRTGRPASIAAFPTKESAELAVKDWQERDRKGGRPDVSHIMPFLEVRRDCP